MLPRAIEDSCAVVHQRTGRGQWPTTRAEVKIALMVVSEVLTREGAVRASRLVEHSEVRLNPMLVDKPAEHLGRAIGAIAKQAPWVQVKALDRPFNHFLALLPLMIAAFIASIPRSWWYWLYMRQAESYVSEVEKFKTEHG